MKQTFYSNGKLLLTGEYAVLDGALALALPTKFGQNLTVERTENAFITWKSYDSNGSVWFETSMPISAILNLKSPTGESVTSTLIKILQAGFRLRPNMLESHGYKVTTRLTFPRQWGLGTSSTLINNIAQWLQIDAYALLKDSFGGSGYDIACAQHDTPILYHLENGNAIAEEIDFNPDFKDQLYFVYLNQKQSSKKAIAAYRTHQNEPHFIDDVSALTQAVISATNKMALVSALDNHERLLSERLGVQKVKDALFADFNGSVKSLGAWGGDFVLAISEEDPTAYFNSNGFNTVIPYREMIL